ncbi:hypothetical protein M422DRAFT_243555 [Sphaerobolus stellatus SS14]|nr:hypothetical protein M422DRAFT_243555 [Sphaerobolus stellatus SS14]
MSVKNGDRTSRLKQRWLPIVDATTSTYHPDDQLSRTVHGGSPVKQDESYPPRTCSSPAHNASRCTKSTRSDRLWLMLFALHVSVHDLCVHEILLLFDHAFQLLGGGRFLQPATMDCANSRDGSVRDVDEIQEWGCDGAYAIRLQRTTL